MATSEFESAASTLAWSQWVALGVPGTPEPRHGHLNIDLEALVWLTGSVDDARLRQEAMDWLLKYGRLFSMSRVRRLSKLWPSILLDDMLSTVRVESKELRWKTAGHLLPFQPRGHARLDLDHQSTFTHRLRTLLGVEARAEVLSALLCARSPLDHAELTHRTGYSKRAVIDATDSLVEGGFVQRDETRNRFLHQADWKRWRQLLPQPPIWAPWRDICLALLRAATTERQNPDPDHVETLVAWETLRRELSQELVRVELLTPMFANDPKASARETFVKLAQLATSPR